MANDKLKHFNRTDAIDLETAKKVFHDYYNGRTSSKIGRIRAKIFDMMYQKKPRFTLRPGEPGSARYLLEEGPRTFDMEGVDFFPEGTTVTVDDPDYRDNPPKVTSHGATYKHDDDDVDPETIVINEQGKETSSQIYGPRLKTDELYNTHFKEHYNTRKTEGDLKNKFQDKHLVEIYWDKYKQNPRYYARKNKKVTRKQKKVEQKPVRKEEEAQEEIQTHFFEFDNREYSISAELDIYDSEGNVLGNINKSGEIQEEMIEYLIDKNFIQRFGENTYILIINNDKPYKLKNKTDDTIIIVNLADNTVFDENGEKLDISLQEYLEAYGISFSDLEMIGQEAEEEEDDIEETKFYLHPQTNEVIAIKGTNVYAIDDDGYPLKEPLESYRHFKEKYGVEISDLEEVDLEALREDDESSIPAISPKKVVSEIEEKKEEIPEPIDDMESIESIDFLNNLLEKGELEEEEAVEDEEDEGLEDEEYYDEEELPELESDKNSSPKKQQGGYSEEPLAEEEKRYILDSLANYIKSTLKSSQFFTSNIKDMAVDVL